MGNVIRFPVEKVRRSTTNQKVDRVNPAEILLFEGIRYSVDDETKARSQKPVRKPKSV